MRAQVSISTEFFGQNAWWIDITASDPSTSISAANWTAMAASGVKYVRIGGIALNFQPLYTFTGTSIATISKLTNVIDKIRSNGMKPIIEVGFKPDNICTSMTPFLTTNLPNQATIAGNLVTAIQSHYTSLSQPTVNYWIIANEPDNFITNCTTPDGGYGYPYDNAPPLSNGEIHIMDSPFYKNEKERLLADKRKETYYTSLGFPEMAKYYTSHLFNDVTMFSHSIMYRPPIISSILRRLSLNRFNPNPFCWIKIQG